MSKRIEESVFEAVVRYDFVRTLFDNIVLIDDISHIYPEFEDRLVAIRNEMWEIVAKIAEKELENVNKIVEDIKTDGST